MDSDEEFEEAPAWKGVSGTVILINGHDPINSNAPQTAYRGTCELVRQYMRAATAQLLSVCIYGVETSDNDDENFVQVFPLTNPTLDDFKSLQNLSLSTYKQPNEFKLSTVLWHANKMFTNCKKLMSSKSIIMLTRMDIPPVEADRKPALKRVVDLVDSAISVKIVNISNTNYHCDDFYKKLLTEASKGNEYDEPPCVWDLPDITKSIQKFSHRHLAVATLSFQIAEDFAFGVGVYNLLLSHTKPKKVIADKETNQILSRITSTTKVQNINSSVNGENGLDVGRPSNNEVPLLKSELLFYQVFGDEKIEFTVDEMKQLKNPFGPPMLKLLGFKPISLLSKEKWYLKTCYFLYPNENYIEGSTVAFKAFHQACSEMSVIAICVFTSRHNARPKLVALRPCKNPLGLDVKIGFDIIHIPFDENVRNVPINEESEKKVDLAHKIVLTDIIKALKFDYNPEIFENPNLQSLLRSIEALALEQEDVEPYEDTTKPNKNQLNNIDGSLFAQVFGTFGATASKRPAASNPKANVKRGKAEDLEIDESLLLSRISTNQVQKYTVDELKKILKAKNISEALTGLKKNELIKMVYDNS